jgi:hypothetical protein
MKQWHNRLTPAGKLVWDVDRLQRLAQDLPTKTVPLDHIFEFEEVYWFEVFRLPTVLQEMKENAQRQQALQQAAERAVSSMSSLQKAAHAWEETSRPWGEMQQCLPQTLGSPSALTALQEVEEVYRQAQERHQTFELIVGDQSVWSQARHAVEACGSQARALQERAAQCGRELQSQMEQATALVRGVGWDPAHTSFAPGGLMDQALTYLTDLTSSKAFRFIGPKDLTRLGPSEAQLQAERHIVADKEDTLCPVYTPSR